MKNRLLSLLLIAALILPCFSACASDTAGSSSKSPTIQGVYTGDGVPGEDSDVTGQTPSEQGTLTVAVQDDAGLTPNFIDTLNSSLIMLVNSDNSYVQGTLTSIQGGSTPAMINDTLYLPAAFVSEAFGAETSWDETAQTLNVQWDSNTMSITADADSIIVNGSTIALSSASVIENDVLLTPAEPLCQGLSQNMYCSDDLLIVGPDLSTSKQDVPEDSLNTVFSALSTKLAFSQVGGLTTGSKKTYEEWTQCTKSIVIDPTLAPWSSAKDELAASSGSLYIENISITPAEQDTYNCTMDVYNYLGYTYGSVEVYDANDRLKEVEQIKPFSGQKDSITGAICDVCILMGDVQKAIANQSLDYLNYKTKLNSQIDTIQVNIPVGGYVIITCNPMHSEYVAVYNMTHTLVETMFALDEIGSIFKTTEDLQTTKQIIKDYLIEEILKNTTLIHEISTEYRIFLSNMEEAGWYNMKSFVESTCQSLLDMLSRVEFDVWGLVTQSISGAAGEVVDSAAETALKKIVPGADIPLVTWKVSTNLSNLFCLFMDISSVCNTQSLMLETYDWKSAYAQILRDYPTEDATGNLCFLTGYINNDMVPELMIIDAVAQFGSTMEVYSFQNRKIVQLSDPYGSTEFNVPSAMFNYVELEGIMFTGNMHRGYVSVQYSELDGAQFHSIHSFNDNESAVGDVEAEYAYNGRSCSKWYYHWKLDELDKEYKDTVINVSGFSDGHELTEENIQKVFA